MNGISYENRISINGESIADYDPYCMIGFKKGDDYYASIDQHVNFFGVTSAAIIGYKNMSNSELKSFFNNLSFIEDDNAYDASFLTIRLMRSGKDDVESFVSGASVPADTEESLFSKEKRTKIKKVKNVYGNKDWEYLFLFDLDKDVLEVYSRLLYRMHNKDKEKSIIIEINRKTNALHLMQGTILLLEEQKLQR